MTPVHAKSGSRSRHISYCIPIKDDTFIPSTGIFPICRLKGSLTRDFRIRFCHGSVSPRPLSIQRGPFKIFSKICGNIHNIMFITNSTGANGTGDKLSPVSLLSGRNPFSGIFTDSMTPVINLSPVTTMPLLLAIKRLSFPYLFLSYGLWDLSYTYSHFKKRSQYCPVLISTVG